MKKIILGAFALAALFTSCDEDDNLNYDIPSVSADGVYLPYEVLKTTNSGVEIRSGGYGSAATAHPFIKNEFYALTDRGANTKISGGKIFPTPNFTPKIGHFKLKEDGTVEKIKDILLKDPYGNVISGRPNPAGKGATGEIPYDEQMNVLAYDDYGLDSEGLVALKDGSFWVSDEYGPHIVHFDAEGKQLERISPVGVHTNGRDIPAVFEKRWPNRGMEGLAITPDEKTLVGIMQSTLYNPSKAEVNNFTLTRIVTFDLETGATKQYLYQQEKAKNANSEIVALSNTEFLIAERDTKFYDGSNDVQKTIYKIDVANATDVSGDFNNINGKLINGNTLEQSTWEEISAAGISTVQKTLVVDLVETIQYPHDKLEGFWLIDDHKIGVINDDDFAVAAQGTNVIQKHLPLNNEIDGNKLYIIEF